MMRSFPQTNSIKKVKYAFLYILNTRSSTKRYFENLSEYSNTFYSEKNLLGELLSNLKISLGNIDQGLILSNNEIFTLVNNKKDNAVKVLKMKNI